MADELGLEPYTNGTRSVIEGSVLEPALITPQGRQMIERWNRGQAHRAIHESGHVCLGALEGIVTNSVSIKGGHRWGGRTETDAGEDTQSEYQTVSRMRSEVVALCGGLESERRLMAEPTDGSASDLMTAAKVAAVLVSCGALEETYLTPLQVFGYEVDPPASWVSARFELIEEEMRRGRERAKALIDEHHEAVLGFAKLLFQARRMDGLAIDAALAAVGLPVPERKL